MHARYADEGKDRAQEEGRGFEDSGRGIKIIRETYYPDKNQSSEMTIYVSRFLTKEQLAFDKDEARSRQSGGKGGGAKPGASTSDDGGEWGAPEVDQGFHFDEVKEKPLLPRMPTFSIKPKKEPPKKATPELGREEDRPKAEKENTSQKSSSSKPRRSVSPASTPAELILRVVAIGGGSILLAAATTGVFSFILGRLPSLGISISAEGYKITLLGIFVLVFLSSAIPMAIKYLQLDEMGKGDSPAPKSSAPKKSSSFFSGGRSEDEPTEAMKFNYKDEPEEEAPAEEAEKEEPKAEEKVEEKEEEKVEEKPESTHGISENDRLSMMKFLGGIVNTIKGARPQLDSYNKFGVLLLIAGANEVLSESKGYSDDDRIKLLRETIEVMGTKPDLAKSFCSKLEEYVMEPRYMPMIQAGREAMTTFMRNGDSPFGDLKNVFDIWNKPTSSGSADQGVMTVMFTDMVGSTNLTQTQGDFGAQVVVRMHNQIVRTALAMHNGKEVKHTGDGIMASFSSAASAVEACVEIQSRVAEHNKKTGTNALHLRIGLNAGEPIREENDIFGTTVQLAARICDKAGTDRILVSNVVRELSIGRSFKFVSRGAFALKGVNEPQTLYEVVWNEALSVDGPPAAAPAPAPQAPAAPLVAMASSAPVSPMPAAARAPHIKAMPDRFREPEAQAVPDTPSIPEAPKPRPRLEQNPFSMR